MPKICEYPSVKCCYCGSDNIVDTGEKTLLNQHGIFCRDCMGTFYIPCED